MRREKGNDKQELLTIDATVCAVSAATLLHSTISLGVRNNKFISGDPLHFSVSFSVPYEVQNELRCLLWPATFRSRCVALVLSLCVATGATSEFGNGHGFLVVNNVLQVSLGTLKLHALDGIANLTCMLEVHAQVRAASFCGFISLVRFLTGKKEELKETMTR
jgi:hypothetical protein